MRVGGWVRQRSPGCHTAPRPGNSTPWPGLGDHNTQTTEVQGEREAGVGCLGGRGTVRGYGPGRERDGGRGLARTMPGLSHGPLRCGDVANTTEPAKEASPPP